MTTNPLWVVNTRLKMQGAKVITSQHTATRRYKGMLGEWHAYIIPYSECENQNNQNRKNPRQSMSVFLTHHAVTRLFSLDILFHRWSFTSRTWRRCVWSLVWGLFVPHPHDQPSNSVHGIRSHEEANADHVQVAGAQFTGGLWCGGCGQGISNSPYLPHTAGPG